MRRAPVWLAALFCLPCPGHTACRRGWLPGCAAAKNPASAARDDAASSANRSARRSRRCAAVLPLPAPWPANSSSFSTRSVPTIKKKKKKRPVIFGGAWSGAARAEILAWSRLGKPTPSRRQKFSYLGRRHVRPNLERSYRKLGRRKPPWPRRCGRLRRPLRAGSTNPLRLNPAIRTALSTQAA